MQCSWCQHENPPTKNFAVSVVVGLPRRCAPSGAIAYQAAETIPSEGS
jgi:hypothetical protein